MSEYYIAIPHDDYVIHHGVLGQKWGVRRYQNPDGSLTPAGIKRYGGEIGSGKSTAKQYARRLNDTDEEIVRERSRNKFYQNNANHYTEKLNKLTSKVMKQKARAESGGREISARKAERELKKMNSLEAKRQSNQYLADKHINEANKLGAETEMVIKDAMKHNLTVSSKSKLRRNANSGKVFVSGMLGGPLAASYVAGRAVSDAYTFVGKQYKVKAQKKRNKSKVTTH